MYPMAAKRPDWTKINRQDAEDNGYVTITKGTAKLAKSALRYQTKVLIALSANNRLWLACLAIP